MLTTSHLSAVKDKLLPLQRCGVYRLRCHCGATYIGQSGRAVEERIKEHEYAYRSKTPQKSAMAKHCLEHNHPFAGVNVTILHTATKGRLLDRLEEFEILSSHRHNTNNTINEIDYTFNNAFITYILSP